MRVTMRHIRAAGLCSRGARVAAQRCGINWQEFLDKGLEMEVLRNSGLDSHFLDKVEEQLGVEDGVR